MNIELEGRYLQFVFSCFQKNEIENLGRNIYKESVPVVGCSSLFFAVFRVWQRYIYINYLLKYLKINTFICFTYYKSETNTHFAHIYKECAFYRCYKNRLKYPLFIYPLFRVFCLLGIYAHVIIYIKSYCTNILQMCNKYCNTLIFRYLHN